MTGLASWPAAAAWMVALLALVACVDGYPTDDVPQTDPGRMTRSQLLDELNTMGDAPHLGQQWRYALVDECTLVVRVRNGDAERRQVPLDGAVVDLRSADGVTEVLVVPADAGLLQPVAVLASRRWPDTVRARALLTQLEMRCGRPDPAPT